jgi:hypothetical protein
MLGGHLNRDLLLSSRCGSCNLLQVLSPSLEPTCCADAGHHSEQDCDACHCGSQTARNTQTRRVSAALMTVAAVLQHLRSDNKYSCCKRPSNAYLFHRLYMCVMSCRFGLLGVLLK